MKLGKCFRLLITAALALLISTGAAPAPRFRGFRCLLAPAAAGAGEEKAKKAVAAASGPITVKERVADSTLEGFLAKFLPKYPGVRTMTCCRR